MSSFLTAHKHKTGHSVPYVVKPTSKERGRKKQKDASYGKRVIGPGKQQLVVVACIK